MQSNNLLNVDNNNKHTIVIPIMITACIPLRLNRGHVTARRSDFSQPSAADMEAQVNILRALLPVLVNKRTHKKQMQQIKYVFSSDVRSSSNDC